MATIDDSLDFDTLYLLAETDSRRIAVGQAKANALWRKKHPDGSLPDIEFLDRFTKPFLGKETKLRALGFARIKSEAVDKIAQDMARDIMLDNQAIERHLKMEEMEHL